MGGTLARICLVAVLLVGGAPADAAGLVGAAALRARYGTLAPQIARNAFGAPLVLQSEEAPRRAEGEVYAVLAHPFGQVEDVLADPGTWCDILILHLNTKLCQTVKTASGPRMDLRVGRKEPQRPEQAALLSFMWLPGDKRADYFSSQLDSDEGPYGTRDYRIFVEAVPLDNGRTFLHMGYAFGYGGGSSLALRVYLATVAHDKVGFTQVRADGHDAYIDGVRGVAERNTMRYYLAIDAYIDSLSAPRDQQAEARLARWFDATERYPLQLHELARDDYLRMKRDELRRQAAVR